MNVLDTLYSNGFYMTTLLIVTIFLFVGLAFLSPFKNKNLNWCYKAFMYLAVFCILMSLQFFYYGLTNEFKKMYLGKTTICLFESYERGGDGPSENVCRIHIIDKATGVRKDRFYTGGYGEIVGIKNDTLCYLKEDDVVVYDATGLKEIYSIKKDDWGLISPELGVGMEHISSNQNRNNAVKPFVELNCKNGKNYWFDPFSKKLLEKEPEDIYIPEFTSNTYELEVNYGINKRVRYLEDAYVNGGKLKKIVPANNSRKLFHVTDSSAYIDPFFLCIDTLQKVFVFGHYTTTDRANFFLEAKDFDFKTLWKKKSEEFGATDDYNKPVFNICKYTGNLLYFNCGGFILAINPTDAKIKWISRL